MTRQRTQAACLEASFAKPFSWDQWNADMDARFAATQRSLDAWKQQAKVTHAAGLAVVEAFESAVEAVGDRSCA